MKPPRALLSHLGATGAQAVSGGCIHSCFRLDTADGAFFLKLNRAELADSFVAEADGLRAIAAAGMRAPQVHGCGVEQDQAYLLLEWLDLSGAAPRALGVALANMHAHVGDRFGWARDNFIGATPQQNAPAPSWIEFWRDRRLLPQLKWARQKGHALREGDELVAALPRLLEGHDPAPALLHGDLWNGNAGALRDGTPVVFDPAVYYGDAETDLAMTELFGGFGPAFFEGYRSVRSIDGGYARRKPLYNLYHLLNHLNLFGGAYLRQCESTMRALLDSA